MYCFNWWEMINTFDLDQSKGPAHPWCELTLRFDYSKMFHKMISNLCFSKFDYNLYFRTAPALTPSINKTFKLSLYFNNTVEWLEL